MKLMYTILNVLSIVAIFICLGFSAHYKWTHIDETNTRQLVNTWQYSLTAFIAAIVFYATINKSYKK